MDKEMRSVFQFQMMQMQKNQKDIIITTVTHIRNIKIQV